MIKKLIEKIIGTKNERELKKLQPIVNAVNGLEPWISKLTDDELKAKTNEFKEKLHQGASLDDILIEAFAVVRETAKRTLNMRHFDVQLMGGIVLHQGKIAEMKTGEGKTLVATLPAYLNALTGEGVHIVTVNDYLAKRDTEWMGPIYRFLGLTVGTIQHGMSDEERKKAYQCDITYGTNNEFGFDYLRDNMKFRLEDIVQRRHNYAIVDEVDSILIDEARTPLIISGPSEESIELYYKVDDLVRRLRKDEDYQLDEKAKTVVLTEWGVEKAEKYLGVNNLFDITNQHLVHHIYQALRAHNYFKRDVDYIVKDGKVIIVDEFTGRLMPGRRWSDGLHQAVEAKERVRIEQEYQTLATITFQNYFKLYKKLAGMTGTAETEATEFAAVYNLDVVVIPTNKPLIRYEYPDVIYRTEREKWDAVVEEIEREYRKGRPVLVGTISIEKSEKLSSMLKRRGIKHVVLNAKYHEKEAEIVAQAGRFGAVTIATNMAGRGTDILLGGNPEFLAKEEMRKRGFNPHTNWDENLYSDILEKMKKQVEEEHSKVVELLGLYIIGTERHEARRIDNQLRGRAGRQGDPGASKFFLSLEDDLMRIFGSDRLSGLMKTLGMEEGVPIQHKWVSSAIERAQKQVEAHNFSIRKHLLEYDDVMNKQREVIYSMRREILEKKDVREWIEEKTEILLDWHLEKYCDSKRSAEDWDIEGLRKALLYQFSFDISEIDGDFSELSYEGLREILIEKLKEIYAHKERMVGEERMRDIERYALLQVIDYQWKDHLLAMDHLKEGIGLRGYGQRDPLIEYKKESFDMFQEMMDRIEEETIRILFHFQPMVEYEELSFRTRQTPRTQIMSRGESAQRTQKPRLAIPKKRRR
ncbi:MAG: preprotein translocase subunit SecA [Candidatus Aminicenantia bacterium]